MKLSRFVHGNVCLSWLMLVVLVNFAIAGTPGKCEPNVPASACPATCGQAGSDSNGVPCFVRISETNGLATATAQNLRGGVAGSYLDPICVDPSTEILWFTLEEKSTFKVTFGVPHPFANTGPGKAATFKGKKGQASSDTANSPTNCYQYSLQHSNNGSRASADPKVIVTSGTEGDNQSKHSVKK
jgi:hypothetical protein